MAMNPSMHDPFADATRGRMEELYRGYKCVIDSLAEGIVPPSIPWHDQRFQDMVVQLIGAQRKYKADADKLAVIRDVFGGK